MGFFPHGFMDSLVKSFAHLFTAFPHIFREFSVFFPACACIFREFSPFPTFSNPFPHVFPTFPMFSPCFPRLFAGGPLGARTAEDAQRQNHAPRAAEAGAAGLPDAGEMDGDDGGMEGWMRVEWMDDDICFCLV